MDHNYHARMTLISVASALIRVYFIKCHFGKASKLPLCIEGSSGTEFQHAIGEVNKVFRFR